MDKRSVDLQVGNFLINVLDEIEQIIYIGQSDNPAILTRKLHIKLVNNGSLATKTMRGHYRIIVDRDVIKTLQRY